MKITPGGVDFRKLHCCRNLIWFVFLLTIDTAKIVTGQDHPSPSNTPQKFVFEHITVADGLPHNNVNAIIQDHRGFLWFATQNGLVKYDGYTFTTFVPEPDDANSISADNLITILEDHQGVIWVGTWQDGLNRYDPRTGMFTYYRHDEDDPNSLITDGVYTLFEDRSGILWLGTVEHGLERFERDTGTFSHFRHHPDDPSSLSSDAVNTICEDRIGNLWVGTSNGLNKFDRKSGTAQRYFHQPDHRNSLIHNTVTQLYTDQTGILWIGTLNGLDQFDPVTGSFRHFQHDGDNPYSLNDNNISTIFEDHQGQLWIGTRSSGLNRLDRKTGLFNRYRMDANDPTSLNGDWIRAIYEDRSGVLWIGCWLTGLNKLDSYGQKFTQYKHDPDNPNSLNNNWIWALHVDSQGILWIGTRNAGLNRFDPDTGIFQHYLHDPGDPKSLSYDNIGCIYEDRTGNLWIGTFGGGLDRLVMDATTGSDRQDASSSPAFLHYRHEPGNTSSLSHNSIQEVYEDSKGNLWIGTLGGGLNKLIRDTSQVAADGSAGAIKFVHYRHDPGNPGSLNGNRVNVVFEDASGNIWVGTDGQGLDRFDQETESFTHYYDRTGGFQVIGHLYEDTSGRFWVGTYNAGLFLFDPGTGRKQNFSEAQGLAHKSIKGILEDRAGHLWLATERGLSKFNPDQGTFRNYDVSDGLQSNHFNFKAHCHGDDGLMYFGGSNGFNSFHPQVLRDNPFPPQVVLTDVKIFNRPVSQSANAPLTEHINTAKEIRLSYRQRDISIVYAGLHFSMPEKNSYAYKLENYEDGWREVGPQRIATYTNLDPGRYVFRVKAANRDGLWNEESVALDIIISPPFWQTLWFKASVLLCGIFAVFGAYRKRISHIEAKKRALEIQVKEKTEIATALQTALDEVERLKNRLHAENVYLQKEIKIVHNFEDIVTCSDGFKKVLASVEQVASTDATVLILGESGTGKELIARAVHSISPRGTRPLVKVNCSALPANLIESEFFGHEKGAFTGAISREIGRFELADGGTIFLDEIGDLPFELQAKLLRVLQEGDFERLGSPKTIHVDVRVIAATNRDLDTEVGKGHFRRDLYYRLNVFPITVPPLRERNEDIAPLVDHFVKKYSVKIEKRITVISQNIIDTLQTYDWPGNIRELENIVERAVIISQGNKLTLGDWLPKPSPSVALSQFSSLAENEKKHIIAALQKTDWRVSGENGAAKILRINPQTLVSRMKKLNIQRSAGDNL